MQWKPERSEVFDVTIHPDHGGVGQTTPEQTGDYSHFATFLHILLPLREGLLHAKYRGCPRFMAKLTLWEFNFAVRHTEACFTKLWRHNDLIYARYHHWRFCQKINCSKPDVTNVSGSQATERTCNNYSGSNERSFCPCMKRHDTLLLLSIITKVVVECIIEPAQLRACQILMEQPKENGVGSWQDYTSVPVTYIYGCRHHDHHK